MLQQANNLPVTILPGVYANQSHGQSSYSTDDLPRNVVMTISPGSAVKSMDFHPVQQILLLGKQLFRERGDLQSNSEQIILFDFFLSKFNFSFPFIDK